MRRTALLALLLALGACGSSGAKAVDAGTGDAGTGDAQRSCVELSDLHLKALDEARRCDPDGGRNECQIVTKVDLLCGCQTIVNDDTVVRMLEAEFDARSCRTQPPFDQTPCAAGCLIERSRTCVPVDGGGGICQLPSP